ncbi:MAG: hypothetical protein ACAI34_07540 [Verrucomicrobium sp.]
MTKASSILVGLLAIALACSSCVYYGPVDTHMHESQAPPVLREALRNDLAPGEKVDSIVERKFRGKLVGYHVTIRSLEGSSKHSVLYRNVRGKVVREQITTPPLSRPG